MTSATTDTIDGIRRRLDEHPDDLAARAILADAYDERGEDGDSDRAACCRWMALAGVWGEGVGSLGWTVWPDNHPNSSKHSMIPLCFYNWVTNWFFRSADGLFDGLLAAWSRLTPAQRAECWQWAEKRAKQRSKERGEG